MSQLNQIIESVSDYEGSIQKQEKCIFCDEDAQQLTNMIEFALFGKYASSQNFFYTKQINEIIDQELTPAYATFHQYEFLDDQDQFLKREYSATQYNKKITGLGEYYKYHKEIPRIFGLPIQKTLGKYYDKKRDFEYKKIKKILKEQQVDLEQEPTQNSDSFHSSYLKKSKYSNILTDLIKEFQRQEDQMKKNKKSIILAKELVQKSESVALFQIYQKLNEIAKGNTEKLEFGGSYLYNSGLHNFEKWMKKNKYMKQSKTKFQKRNFKKIKYEQSTATKVEKSKNDEEKKKKSHLIDRINSNLTTELKNALHQNNELETFETKRKIIRIQNPIPHTNIVNKPISKKINTFEDPKIRAQKSQKQREKELQKLMYTQNKPKNINKFSTIDTQRQIKNYQLKQQKNIFMIFDSKKKSLSVGKIVLRPQPKGMSANKIDNRQKSKQKIRIKSGIKNRKSQSVPTIKNDIKPVLNKIKFEVNITKKPSFLQYIKDQYTYNTQKQNQHTKFKKISIDPSNLYKRLKNII